MPEVNVVNTTPETTHVNTFFRLLRDQKSATKAIEAHNQLATVLVELKMLAPGSSIVHKGKVQKTVAAYEDQERDSFTHLIEIREKVLPKADEPFVFHAKKFRKSLIKPAVRMVDDELRGRWEAISKVKTKKQKKLSLNTNIRFLIHIRHYTPKKWKCKRKPMTSKCQRRSPHSSNEPTTIAH
mmetsp:Transcript_16956/g.29351  ORF Transcript_16956/g.29351 Transcript_16956/m.29351 type:complete len:183 (+) Transcript_16956:111-659(+)